MKYLILEPKSVTIPGDERSRTNPGHGYPEHTVKSFDVHEFETEDAVIEWMKKHERFNRWISDQIRIFKGDEVQINRSINLTLE
jgi:hypothetical protein